MRPHPRPLAARVCVVVFASAFLVSADPGLPKAPPTRVDKVTETVQGVEITDPYRWLEEQNAPETRSWIRAQNAYTEAVLSKSPDREALKARVAPVLKVETQSAPTEHGGRYFFSRRGADQELSVLYVKKGPGGQDEVLVDPHPLSPDRTTSVLFLDITTDGKVIAYGTRLGGEDEVTITFLDVDTRRERYDRFPKARYSGVSILPDKSGFYYARQNPEGPRVYFHVMGTDPARDETFFGDGYGPGTLLGVGLSDDGNWLELSVSYGSAAKKTEIYVKNLASKGPIVPIVNDVDARFFASFAGDNLYLRTNWNAPKGRILRVDLGAPARDTWKEVVPEGKGAMQAFAPIGGKLFVTSLENVVSKVKIYDADGRPLGAIEMPGLGTVGALRGRWESGEVFFTYASFDSPSTIYRYDAATGRRSEFWRASVPIDLKSMVVEQVWYPSKDGTKVPMFLVHGKTWKKNGANATLLTGYGGFTLSQTPSFSSLAALWVEKGGVFALPSLRGGGEFGEEWHKAGMLDKKQNVFDDFISAAEWLIASKITSREKLAISGGSNGGLLVGAALTQRPDLFGAVVCSAPLLDMVRYHRFKVARFWVPEYGSAEDPAQFRTLYGYSPYHRVKAGEKYPAVLMVSGDSDTRVDPLHARKMAALLQASTGSGKPVLLQYDTKSGHSGGKPVSKQIEDLADELAFLFWQLGGPSA